MRCAEDDDGMASAMRPALRQRGYEVVRAATGAEALAACRDGPPPDLVLLDLGLPDITGHALAVRLHEQAAIPIVVVTGCGELASWVGALRRGADDYVVKPFSIDELLARIEAVLRRSRIGSPLRAETVDVGDVRIDLAARTVSAGGERIALTRKEFDVLATLARAGGASVDRQRLLVEVWGTDWLGMSHKLEVHVATLRSKLGRPLMVETVRGVGYRLATPSPAP